MILQLIYVVMKYCSTILLSGIATANSFTVRTFDLAAIIISKQLFFFSIIKVIPKREKLFCFQGTDENKEEKQNTQRSQAIQKRTIICWQVKSSAFSWYSPCLRVQMGSRKQNKVPDWHVIASFNHSIILGGLFPLGADTQPATILWRQQPPTQHQIFRICTSTGACS